jgi:hypothetical protein
MKLRYGFKAREYIFGNKIRKIREVKLSLDLIKHHATLKYVGLEVYLFHP